MQLSNLPSTGKEARAKGVNKYYTGKPCKFGHVAERYAHNGQCLDCARLATASNRRKPESKVVARSYYEIRRKTPEKIMLLSAKGRARKFKVPFAITEQDIVDVWPKDGLCPILGIKLEHNFDKKGSYCLSSPSLDRIIPELGYVKGNIVVISMKANRLKNDETDPSIFIKIATWLEQNLKGK